jgi:hypothetical protein
MAGKYPARTMTFPKKPVRGPRITFSFSCWPKAVGTTLWKRSENMMLISLPVAMPSYQKPVVVAGE